MYFTETSAEVSAPLKQIETGNKERGHREVKKGEKKEENKEEEERERFPAAFKTYFPLST